MPRKCEWADRLEEHEARYYLRDYREGFALFLCEQHLKDFVKSLDG